METQAFDGSKYSIPILEVLVRYQYQLNPNNGNREAVMDGIKNTVVICYMLTYKMDIFR